MATIPMRIGQHQVISHLKYHPDTQCLVRKTCSYILQYSSILMHRQPQTYQGYSYSSDPRQLPPSYANSYDQSTYPPHLLRFGPPPSMTTVGTIKPIRAPMQRGVEIKAEPISSPSVSQDDEEEHEFSDNQSSPSQKSKSSNHSSAKAEDVSFQTDREDDRSKETSTDKENSLNEEYDLEKDEEEIDDADVEEDSFRSEENKDGPDDFDTDKELSSSKSINHHDVKHEKDENDSDDENKPPTLQKIKSVSNEIDDIEEYLEKAFRFFPLKASEPQAIVGSQREAQRDATLKILRKETTPAVDLNESSGRQDVAKRFERQKRQLQRPYFQI
eukprot:TRINITY_DN1863_c0_g1_i6.p1 TRINITY_DN1863_c0_g1~~TRINITY_DN1863_c0_g1_i6.p1  ORF type:complete len:330 (-),score=14.10 TRINITY_DN1863_c0_g1_i6:316-1305(-)